MNGEALMVRVAGKTFRCFCGCNVFHTRDEQYVCNGCGATYEGQREGGSADEQ